MDSTENYATLYKFSKPVIVYDGRTITPAAPEVIKEEAVIQEEVKTPVVQEPVIETETKTSVIEEKSIANVIDDIASEITNNNEDIVLDEPSKQNVPFMDTPIITSSFSVIPDDVNEPVVDNEEVPSDEEKQVMELTQELKLDLENAEKLTEEFLSTDEVNSLVVEKKMVDVLPSNEALINKYDRLYGPDERGLLNITFNDGNTYMTVLEYLESEDVLSVIPYDSIVTFDNSSDTELGVDFLKNVIIPYLSKNGYHTITDTIDILGAHVEKTEEKKPFIKRLFSRH